MKRTTICTLIFTLIMFQGYAQFTFNENCKNAYLHIIDLKFDQGKALINKEKKENPTNLIPFYLENYIDFLTLNIGENPGDFERLKGNKKTRLRKLEEAKNETPYYRYCLATVNLHWAFVRMKFGEYLTAFFEINSAYRLLEKNKEEYPGFIPDYIALGILHTMVGAIPDNYKWITNILGIHGSIDQGTNELYMVLDSIEQNPEYAYLLTETVFYLSFLELNLSPDKSRSFKLYDYLNNMNDSGPLLSYAKANLLLRNGFNDKAIEILKNRTQEKGQYPFHYLDFVLGRALLNKLHPESVTYLNRFLDNFNGINYKSAACQKLAWFYLLNQDTGNYYRMIARTYDFEKALVDEDKQARYEAKSGSLPNVFLLKGRLFFDGGYHDKALEHLLNEKAAMMLKNKMDSVEYTYRLGRIYHETGQHDPAINYYNRTIENGTELDQYYAANAALMAGKIFEQRGDFNNAKRYYEACLDMDFKVYERSIKFKAKGGINRIEE